MESLHSPITIHEWFPPRKGAFQTAHIKTADWRPPLLGSLDPRFLPSKEGRFPNRPPSQFRRFKTTAPSVPDAPWKDFSNFLLDTHQPRFIQAKVRVPYTMRLNLKIVHSQPDQVFTNRENSL